MLRIRDYLPALFYGWVGMMSGIASVALTFFALFWPKLFADSRISARAVWIAAGVCFFIASYSAWQREREIVDRLSKPDKCPIVRVQEWCDKVVTEVGTWSDEEFNLRKYDLKSASQLDKLGNCGFQLLNEGETAYEVNLEDFKIEPGVVVTAKMVPQIVSQPIGQGFMQAWIKDKEITDQTRWDLPLAFQTASSHQDGPKSSGLGYSTTLRLTYRDHNNCWYCTIQEIAWIPAKYGFEFGPLKHAKLGLNRGTR